MPPPLSHPDLRPAAQAVPAAAGQAGREPTGPRAQILAHARAAWCWLVRLNARIEASWLGDAIGCACLCATFVILIIIAGVLQ